MITKDSDGKHLPAEEIIKTLGEGVIQTAISEWELDVVDRAKSKESCARIDRYIRDRNHGLSWTWEKPYERDGQYQWCGAFAGACWRNAGLNRVIAMYGFSSTGRLDRLMRYLPPTRPEKWANNKVFVTDEAAEKYPQLHGLRGRYDLKDFHLIMEAPRLHGMLGETSTVGDLPFDVQLGDIVLVGKRKSDARNPRKWTPWGGHVTLCAGPPDDDGYIPTYEGNARGLGPDGRKREGVIKWRRPIGHRKGAGYHVRRVLRLSWLDCIPELEYPR